jgi:hypothetical protein
LLKDNQEKIDWWSISRNPSIFEKKINYTFLKHRMDIIREELIMKTMHPRRLDKWIDMGGEIDDF